ncbi:patatin-like protein [Temperatibacter marinus]|uniref:Patatin-like protein n=1 Tax=Temperatibacter marinus TaxID=1456591 RepID=A0AA52EFJ8_9PROT|nr:patatin-like protein [Temperatibacter marinus]WND01617.1 patatin-like protein [Temperatibacter marinus]
MRELELRLALVCYGGASLAVYMNGITAELLNVVRGSRNLYQNDHENIERDSNHPTVELYRQLLEDLSPNVQIRVIVDVISGASAGGINGVMLARALAHDLDFAPLKKMWLDLGDVEELMDSKTIADKWSKLFMVPIMRLFGRKMTGNAFDDPEIKRKLLRFVRSKWFKPPFSGEIMLGWMLEAARDLGKSQQSKGSLLPRGHRLDLFVPVTNFYGQKKTMPLHDPSTISEPRHALTLKFSHIRGYGEDHGQHALSDDNIAALGFAARATSSFPGAFPSVSFNELEEKIHKMGLRWRYRQKFLARNFPTDHKKYALLKKMSFVDGGVTNNKPFDSAIKAIEGRPAHRQVDRRMIFVDPSPETETSYRDQIQPAPGFFKTILGSMTTIPRAEPIYNDLQDIEAHNERVLENKKHLSAISFDAQTYTDQFVTKRKCKHIDVALLASWREQSHESAHKMAGISYGPYIEIKKRQILDLFTQLLAALYKKPLSEMKPVVTEWAIESFLTRSIGAKDENFDEKSYMEGLISLFRSLDLPYRIRRLRYVIKQTTEMMSNSLSDVDYKTLQKIKALCYTHLDDLTRYMHISAFEGLVFDRIDPISHAATVISDHLDLENKDLALDEALAPILMEFQGEEGRLGIVQAYIGFTFYDVLSLPYHRNIHHSDQADIRVNRISPQDCRTILGHEFIGPLMGTELYNFGAFFSRRARENDFLWGRIHAACRMLDFVVNAAKPFGLPEGFDPESYRRNLLLAILEEEEKELTTILDVISALKVKWTG